MTKHSCFLGSTVPDITLRYAVGKGRADNDLDFIGEGPGCVESTPRHQHHPEPGTPKSHKNLRIVHTLHTAPR